MAPLNRLLTALSVQVINMLAQSSEFAQMQVRSLAHTGLCYLAT